MVLLVFFTLVLVAAFGAGPQRFNFGFSGKGKARSFSFDMQDNVGFVDLGWKKFFSVAYYTQQMGNYSDYPFNLQARWVDLFGVSSDGSDIIVAYITCDPVNVSSEVPYFWYETLTVELTSISADSGTCAGFVDANTTVSYSPPKFKMPNNVRSIDTGITILGSSIYLRKTVGWIVLSGIGNLTTHMLSTVDCSDCVSNCLECEPGPWWELHFFASKPSDSSFGMFGIYYIFPANKTFVQLNYTISVPDLLQPSLNLEANWNGDLN